MYDLAKKARSGMKSKAERLAGEKDRKVDSSDWSPAEPLNADVKTGMRPVSRRAYKNGGKVADCAAPMRADRKARKAGGKVEAKGEQPLVDRYINRDLKKANDYRDGKKHVGALKHGGRAHKNEGGGTSNPAKDALRRAVSKGKPIDWDKIAPAPYALAIRRQDAKEAKEGLAEKKARPLKPEDYKSGGRAAKANGGSMTMEEMIKKNPAPAKKPLGLDKVPLPPRRPANMTTAVPSKPDPSKYITGDDITGPPKYKEMPLPRGSKPKYEDMPLPRDFKPTYENMKKGGRAKKADGGPMMQDPRLGIVKPKAMEFGQNVVTPGLKSGGRAKKADGGSTRQRFNQAFKEARAAFLRGEGPKTFTFEGGTYGTDLYKPTTGPSTRGRGKTSTPDVKPSFGTPPMQASKFEGGKQDMTAYRSQGPSMGTTSSKYNPIREENDGRSIPTFVKKEFMNMDYKKGGGRVAKQIGGALGRGLGAMALGASMRPQTPQQMPMGTNPAMIGRRPMAQPMQQAMPSMPQTTSAILPQIDTTGSAPLTQSDALAQLGVAPMTAYANGGRIARAYGGEAKPKSKGKGKTNINIIIATGGKKEPDNMVPTVPPAPMGAQPVPVPAAPPAAPMGAGTPPSAPMLGGPPAPAGGPMMPPMPRKAGGRVSKVAHSYKDMTAGAGSGEGRLQKTDIAKRAPHKRGGKVYRSYKDMDAGAGSGEGRLEKTEIQKRKH